MGRYYIEGDEIEVNDFDVTAYIAEQKAKAKVIKEEIEILLADYA